jgi:hypothetical protein
MRTGYPQTEGTGAAIALYLAVSMFVCGLFGFGFYNMLQPRQIQNPGLAAYRPPPATVIRYAATAKFIYGQAAPPEGATEGPSNDTPDETTGRAAQVAEPPIPVVSMPAPPANSQAAKRPARVRSAAAKAHQARSARAGRTASASAQAGYRSVVAAYPGYAAIH